MIQQFHFWMYAHENESRGLQTHVHSSIIHNDQKWELPNCLPMDEWINKMCKCTLDHYSGKKGNPDMCHNVGAP